MKPSNLLPLRTWAKANNVSYAHAYAMAREGRMPVVRLGRRIYVHLASIEAWLARGAQEDDLE
jgi:excisionase family DNA binding protein